MIKSTNYVKIHKGSITDEILKVDAIVNSTSKNLELNNGQLSRAIFNAAGEQIQNELTKNYPDGIEYNQVAVSTNGKLKDKKFIFHCSISDWNQTNQDSSRIQLKAILFELLKEANRRKLNSIAIPAMGTGILGYPKNLIPKFMYESVHDYLKENSNQLKDIYFVVFPGDAETLRSFEKYISESNLQKSSEYKIDKLVVRSYIGDIVKSTDDAIFNPVNGDFDFEGSVAKALLKADGSKMKSDLEQMKKDKKLKEKQIARTNVTNLNCKAVLHVNVVSNSIEKYMITALEEMNSSKDLKTLTLPVIGTNMGGINRHESIGKIIDGIIWYMIDISNRNEKLNIKIINICIYPDLQSEETLSIFDKEIEKKLNDPNHNTNFVELKKVLQRKSSGLLRLQSFVLSNKNSLQTNNTQSEKKSRNEENSRTENSQQTVPKKSSLSFKNIFKIKDNSRQSIRRDDQTTSSNSSRNCFDNQIDNQNYRKLRSSQESLVSIASKSSIRESIVENEHDSDKIFMHFDNPNLTRLDDETISKLNEIGENFEVDIEYEDGRVVLFGTTINILVCQQSIFNFLITKHITEVGISRAKSIQWEFEEKDTWTPFSLFLNNQIESNFEKKYLMFMIDNENNERFLIDINKMIQVNEVNSSVVKKIRRTNFSETSYHIELPQCWDIRSRELFIDLYCSDPEYIKIANLLKKSGLSDAAGNLQNILSIQRIQNKRLYIHYSCQKEAFESKYSNSGEIIELELFHGTSEESVKNICNNGFNRSYAGKNAVLFGRGVYFSNSSALSHTYTDVRIQKNKKHIIVSKVLIGKCGLGTKDSNLPPKDCDTGINRLNDPNIFVIYHDAQAYPEYLVTYE